MRHQVEMSSRHFKILVWHSGVQSRDRDLRAISIRFLFRAIDLKGITQGESVDREDKRPLAKSWTTLTLRSSIRYS